MLRKIFFIFTLSISSLLTSNEKSNSPICLFTPPEKWSFADPSSLSQHVLVGYIGEAKKLFRPSLNLASEEVSTTSLIEYIRAVKQIHSEDKNTTLRELGKIKTQAGEAVLLEISSKSTYGDVRMLQVILLKNHRAYILTGASLKKDFSSFQKELFASLSSLNVIDNLYEVIGNIEKQDLLKGKMLSLKEEIIKNNLLEKEKHLQQKLENFESFLSTNFKEQGNYWHILVMKQLLSDCHNN